MDQNSQFVARLRRILAPEGITVLAAGDAPPDGFTTSAHFDAVSEVDAGDDQKFHWMKWACLVGANVAELRAYVRAVRGEDLSGAQDQKTEAAESEAVCDHCGLSLTRDPPKDKAEAMDQIMTLIREHFEATRIITVIGSRTVVPEVFGLPIGDRITVEPNGITATVITITAEDDPGRADQIAEAITKVINV